MRSEEVRAAAAIVLAVPLITMVFAGPGLLAGPEPAPAAAPTGQADAGSSPPYSNLEHVAQVPGIRQGGGVWVDGDHGYVTGYNSDRFHVVDLSDPTAPTVVGEDRMFGRDVNVVHHPDGNTYALVAQNDAFRVVDVSDPTDPTVVGAHGANAHNLVDLPGTTYVYVANSAGDDSSNVIVDVGDPSRPTTAGRWGDTGCHDIELNTDLDRLYCSGVGRTEIWDISSPLVPQHVTTITNPLISAPGAVPQKPNFLGAFGDLGPGLHHWSVDAQGGDLLIIGDEYAGGLGPGCTAHAQTTAAGQRAQASDPVGALWFYDISDVDDPELLSWYSPTVPADDQLGNGWTYPSCTSHFGEVIDGADQLVVGWYRAGTVLVDFADPSQPLQAAQWRDNAVTWDARLAGDGYLLTGDLARGSDILRLT